MRVRLPVVISVGVAALTFAVPSSLAGTVSVVVSQPFDTSVFRAGGGETNVLDIARGVVFTDSGAPLTAGAGCVSTGPNSAVCSGVSVEADLRDGNDTASVVIDGIGTVFAGPGDDTVTADSFGNFTVVYGEAGDDDIAANGEGNQLADGGPGDDIVHAGGFAGNGTGIGGPGRDVIFFNTNLGGIATLDGGPGADTIVAQFSGFASTATGGSGDDTIVIQGPPPAVGTFGSYTVSGGAGSDTIDVLGGGADTVTCGPGLDVVRFDPSDSVAADCEILLP